MSQSPHGRPLQDAYTDGKLDGRPVGADLPSILDEEIDRQVDAGVVQNRSHAVREALRHWLEALETSDYSRDPPLTHSH
jgi:hypothetical protein